MAVDINGRTVFNNSDINNPDIDGGTIDNATIVGGSVTGITDLAVADGGTGASTLTDHGVLLGSGTDPITALGAMTNGQLVIGSTGADPVVASITDGEGIDTTGGAGTLTIACEDASTTNKGVVELATITEAVAGTSTTLTPTCDGVAAAVAVVSNPKAFSQGVAMTYAASGSTGIQVATDDDLNMATNNFGFACMDALPDITPSADVILAQKHDGSNGWIFKVLTTGYLRLTINATSYDSTATLASIGCIDTGRMFPHFSVTRESATVAGSVVFGVNGVQLGASVAITAGAPTTVSNTSTMYILGGSTVRYAGITSFNGLTNFAPTIAEWLEVFRLGTVPESWKWGSQTAVYTSDFSAGEDGWIGNAGTVVGNIDGIGGQDDNLRLTIDATSNNHSCKRGSSLIIGNRYKITFSYYIPSTNSDLNQIVLFTSYWGGGGMEYLGTLDTWMEVTREFVATSSTAQINVGKSNASQFQDLGGDDVAYIRGITITQLGTTFLLEPEGMQPAPGQWLDSSTNKLHAMQPATGSSLTRYKKEFEFRWTNTWTASSAAQYVGGLNQAVLSADHFITDIITQATVTTDVENLTLGDGSDADRFVAAFAPSATRTKQTVAAQNDGTNLKLVYTPAAEATMTVETIIRGFIWEP